MGSCTNFAHSCFFAANDNNDNNKENGNINNPHIRQSSIIDNHINNNDSNNDSNNDCWVVVS